MFGPALLIPEARSGLDSPGGRLYITYQLCNLKVMGR